MSSVGLVKVNGFNKSALFSILEVWKKQQKMLFKPLFYVSVQDQEHFNAEKRERKVCPPLLLLLATFVFWRTSELHQLDLPS